MVELDKDLDLDHIDPQAVSIETKLELLLPSKYDPNTSSALDRGSILSIF